MSSILLTAGVFFWGMMLFCLVYRQSFISKHSLVKSSVDKKLFWVVKSETAANLLAKTRKAMFEIISNLPDENNDWEINSFVKRVKRLFPGISSLLLFEIDSSRDKSIAFTYNKTEGFFFCLENEVSVSEGDVQTIL